MGGAARRKGARRLAVPPSRPMKQRPRVAEDPEVVVSPLLERELGARPSLADLDRWDAAAPRRPYGPTSVAAALTSRFDGLEVDHRGARAVVRRLGVRTYAGEAGLWALVDLDAGGASRRVIALDRGFERALGVPARDDAREAFEGALREVVDEYAGDDGLAPDAFFGVVSELLARLPAALAAPAPAASLGAWVVERVTAALTGELAAVDGGRGARVEVHASASPASFAPCRDGLTFTPEIRVRRVGARGRVASESAMEIPLGLLGVDTLHEPPPPAARAADALDAVARWKAELRRRLAATDPAALRSATPMDLPLPTSPVALAVQAARHGAPGDRPAAGTIGDRALAAVATVVEVDPASLSRPRPSRLVRAWRVGGFTIALRRVRSGDAGVEESLWLGSGEARLAPVVVWLEDARAAWSADGDEPALRLFATWLRDAIVARGLDRPLPGGRLPSAWLALQDEAGAPIDHRVEEGAVATCGYEDAEGLPSAAELAGRAADGARALRDFVVAVIDPDARFGQRVATLGLP